MGKKANWKKELTSQYLKNLDENSLQIIQKKICQGVELLIDKKVHPMAGGLMEVLCDPAVMKVLSIDQLIKVIDSIYPDSVQDEGWIAKYGDLLLRVLDDAKKKEPDARTAKYEKHLREILIPALRKGSQTKDIWDDVETLMDIYKVAVCLYRYYTSDEVAFDFNVTRADMDIMNLAIPNVKGVGNAVLGIEFSPASAEDKRYAIFICWILEEMLVKQESIEEERQI